ncbi:MAG: hypothetical protein WC796_04230 [Candidatus Pacearchaeota archaeon]|jgi:NAD+ kinase
MKKIFVIGKSENDVGEIKEKLSRFDVIYSESSPDLVIAYGGDGTLLISERRFPEVPKILVKNKSIGKKGYDLSIEEILEKYLAGRYRIQEINKLKAVVEAGQDFKVLIGMNDLVVRNTLPTEAIRFELFIDEKLIGEFIGDGIVVSTSYGSTAYFSSITKTSFADGIGIAFNNTTESVEPMILDEKSLIKIKILRGPAVLVADNNRDFINLEHGEIVEIRQSDEKAKVLVLD